MLLFWLSLSSALVSLLFAGFLFWFLNREKVENEKVRIIGDYIRRGAFTFMSKEIRVMLVPVVCIFLIMLFWPIFGWKMGIAFLSGAIFSTVAGIVGMVSSISSSVRMFSVSNSKYHNASKKALAAGLVVGLAVGALGLIGVMIFYFVFKSAPILYSFGFGASLVALFMRVGGGIFTKTADMSADLTGRLEHGLDENDLRNPAVMADAVGDNVGDVAGASSDFFESYIDSIIVAVILGTSFIPLFGTKAVIVPMVLAGAGLISSILAGLILYFLKLQKNALIVWFTFISAVVFAILSFIVVKFNFDNLTNWKVILMGLIAGLFLNVIAKYYTRSHGREVKKIADLAGVGSAPSIISGLASGFMSVVWPALILSIVIFWSYRLSGFYGLALASLGLLSNIGTILALSVFGPIADNLASMAQMSKMGSEAVDSAKELDQIGNSLSAIGKNLAIGSALLVGFLLLIVFVKAVGIKTINLLSVEVFVGVLLGAISPFVFSAILMKAVSASVLKMVKEIKRQFADITGLMAGTEEPDYQKCIKVSVNSSLRKIILPGILAIVLPMIAGRYLGVSGLTGFLVGSIITSFILAVFMSNAGAAWDNAKQFIGDDKCQGEESNAYKSAMVGDMVGDPLKDVIGPSLNIFIKLMIIVSLIIVPFLI